jgi:hypothetical protein
MGLPEVRLQVGLSRYYARTFVDRTFFPERQVDWPLHRFLFILGSLSPPAALLGLALSVQVVTVFQTQGFKLVTLLKELLNTTLGLKNCARQEIGFLLWCRVFDERFETLYCVEIITCHFNGEWRYKHLRFRLLHFLLCRGAKLCVGS